MRKQYDVAVIGAGPIGSYTAYQLADKGFSVCMFDAKKEIGKHVICAGIISKRAFIRYDLPTDSILSRIDHFSIISPFGQRLEYEPPDVFAYVVSRSIFDKSLLHMAKQVGVDVFMGHRISEIREQSARYTLECEKATYSVKSVVIATGVDYALHQKLKLSTPPRFLNGSQIETSIATDPSCIEIHIGQTFAPGSFGWVVPAGKNASRIGVITLEKGKEWLETMLRKRLRISDEKCGKTTKIKMKPIAYGPTAKSVYGRIVTVGEASGQVKTTTGGGIFYGLLCSEIAVDKLAKNLKANGSLNDYELTWRSTLISELDIGIRMREIASQLSDQKIEDLFTFVKKHRFWVEMLVPRINFDFHSNLLYFCLKSFGALLRFPVA